MKKLILLFLLACASALWMSVNAQQGGGMPGSDGADGMPGAGGVDGMPGSSEGSPGMDEQGEPAFLKNLQEARKQGPKSIQYIGSLLDLGMFYNRRERYADAERVLLQALAIVDSGALRPSPKTAPRPPIVQHHPGGVVSATNCDPPKPYEELMQNLFPALVTAEIENSKYAAAEAHIKRMIALVPSNEVTGSLNLMSAYSSYATLLRKQGRVREAQIYEQKADAINKSFKPL